MGEVDESRHLERRESARRGREIVRLGRRCPALRCGAVSVERDPRGKVGCEAALFFGSAHASCTDDNQPKLAKVNSLAVHGRDLQRELKARRTWKPTQSGHGGCRKGIETTKMLKQSSGAGQDERTAGQAR